MADKFLQVLVANECIHSRFKARNSGLMCKLDLKKIYDRVEWEYSKIRITLIKAANVMLYYMPLFKCPTVISNRIEHCKCNLYCKAIILGRSSISSIDWWFANQGRWSWFQIYVPNESSSLRKWLWRKGDDATDLWRHVLRSKYRVGRKACKIQG